MSKSNDLPWHKSCLYMILTTIFYIVGVAVAGWAITTLLFIAIVIIIETNKDKK